MALEPLVTLEQRLPPVRGIVPLRNRKGKPYGTLDLKRWLRLSRTAFRNEKVDVLAPRAEGPVFAELLSYATELDLRLSLRTDCSVPPAGLDALPAPGLFDVFLCPPDAAAPHLEAWLDACRAAGLPVRVQVHAPFPAGFDARAWADRMAAAEVPVVHLALFDPFVERPACRAGEESARTVALLADTASALAARGIETTILRLPFCVAPPELWPQVANALQGYLDHQQYERRSLELATDLYRRGPIVTGKAIAIMLAQATAYRNPIDFIVLNMLMKQRRWAFARIAALHKLTRHWRVLWAAVRPALPEEEAFAREAARLRERTKRDMGPICGACSLRRICDHASPGFRRMLPGVAVRAVEGEVVYSPQHFAAAQPKHYDPLDRIRAEAGREDLERLAAKADRIVNNDPPDREVDSFDYRVDGSFCEQMPGGVRWFSVQNCEKISTPLGRMDPPFTLCVTFGGGIAEYIGFSFGRHAKVVCPMEGFVHKLVLHVEADGQYVLLRDGKMVRPVEFEGHYVPRRLATHLEPRLSIWNIDETIVTQTVLVWKGRPESEVDLGAVKYSALIVSTRYARRLQATLRSIAHQQGIDLRKVEVVVGYVPGLDATDDVIDSLRVTCPELRIVRSPFPEQNARSKGFLINESAKLASGEWIVLLDSDIILPPDMLARMEPLTADPDCHFIAPDGRKMLSKEVTARILLGELAPWDDWQALLKTPGEFRLREAWNVPIGYCQCFRTSCLEKVPYEEYDHFEGADWSFAMHLRDNFGRERRLSGVAVAHLDHSGSQWYGTQRHY